MKNTFLKGAMVLFVAVVFVLAGCEQSTNLSNTTENTILSLGAPSNLKADVGTDTAPLLGGVILTWDLDSNAIEYEVWRKETEGGSYKKLGSPLLTSGLTEAKYADVISGTNVLKGDTKYTYKVVAVSANSTSRTIVQNGEANLEVSTFPGQFPDLGASFISPVTDLAVTVDAALGVAHIKWDDTNSNPLVRYVVSGNRNGSTTIGPIIVPEGDLFCDYTIPTSPATGTLNIGVKAVFNGNSAYYRASGLELVSSHLIWATPSAASTVTAKSVTGEINEAPKSGNWPGKVDTSRFASPFCTIVREVEFALTATTL
ncbi:hypothetical protein AGMMS50255_8840 [Spirochaetia bacterium]|nr:hypothetical protein AGMMS50255_8840 [Spirochaetia bacterium]